jgi:hypothetical protein
MLITGLVASPGGEVVDDSKWGSVNLDDDIPLDPENISEWYGVVSLVRGTFESCGHHKDTYNVFTERYDSYSVDVLLLSLGEFTPDRTWGLARKTMLGLRKFKNYWKVRIKIVGGPADNYAGKEALTWIEIDKYQFYPYAGKVVIDRFDHIADFFRQYWGTDFGFGD